MAVTGVSASPHLKDVELRSPKTELGKDDFLKILLTQMKYQDPLQPMDNTEYISQMAQLSTLEQMTNMSNEFAALKAYQLMGKNVTATVDAVETGTYGYVSGKVEKVMIEGSNISLIVNDKKISIKDVIEVMESNVGTN